MGGECQQYHCPEKLTTAPLSLRQDDPNAVYKLATSDSARALNTSELSKCAQRPATEVAEEMRRLILRLYGQFLSEDGSAVDYKGIGKSADYKVGERAGRKAINGSRIIGQEHPCCAAQLVIS